MCLDVAASVMEPGEMKPPEKLQLSGWKTVIKLQLLVIVLGFFSDLNFF